jgi:hypothetical protein
MVVATEMPMAAAMETKMAVEMEMQTAEAMEMPIAVGHHLVPCTQPRKEQRRCPRCRHSQTLS